MNMLTSEATTFVAELKGHLSKTGEVDVILAPSFTVLAAVRKLLDVSGLFLAGQNICAEPAGAFTGEVSAAMLKDSGCEYVILGHSERRSIFGETDFQVNQKVKEALRHELKVILCVGETLEQRESNATREVVERQVGCGVDGLENISSLVIAYEPVWAIGTGLNATPEQAQEVHGIIRAQVENKFGGQVARGLRILYGGSVNPGNAAGLLTQPDVDGALVGSASLNIDSFCAIISLAN